ncbi:MAG: hypothetical protein EXR75_16370, partial [Myxococcales bacterium]|nr:hypothetical protein [Myxococcales bacterium]
SRSSIRARIEAVRSAAVPSRCRTAINDGGDVTGRRHSLPSARAGRGLPIVIAVAVVATAASLVGACDGARPANPFVFDVGGSGGTLAEGGASEGGDASGGTGGVVDPTLGGPCSQDAQCDDAVVCTFDGCDEELSRCRFVPDDQSCQNGGFCDGLELCKNGIGCIPGEPVTCSDGGACTIDHCDEPTKSCVSEPRDVDEDGDPDEHCGGGDCDDLDPGASSLAAEVCINAVDDDCDGIVDEPSCASPEHDDCSAPLALTQAGSYAMSTVAASLDYSSSCPLANAPLASDVVAALSLPGGAAVDVQLTARTSYADVSVALMGQCAQPNSEIACSGSYMHPTGERVSKVRARSVGAGAPVILPVYVTSAYPLAVTLKYELLPATLAPTNETCGTALAVTPGVPVTAGIVGSKADLSLGCGAMTGELVYALTLTEAHDVHLYASSLDGDGLPVLALRDPACTSELACGIAPSVKQSAHVFRHALAAGTYYIAVAATAPTEVELAVQLLPATPLPLDELCADAPPLAPNKTLAISLANHQDDTKTGCFPGGVDAVYALALTQPSDVLLLGRFAAGDTASIELVKSGCTPNDGLVCAKGWLSPARAQLRNVPAGDYRVIAESLFAQPMELTALVRAAVPTTLVALSDNCSDILAIPPAGGFFQGNTANATAGQNAGCDQGNQPPGGAPEQLLQLTLATARRVVLDMQGSAHVTLLSVRKGTPCPGVEVPKACAAGYYPDRSFLDLSLGAGTYTIQIDGFAGSSGPWFLDVFVVTP